jgi:hypothetical protein
MSEVPAKRRKLAHRELELLDLDDDALIEIIEKLEHKSKMQLMLTCKRFEGLIGNTFQFYRKYKLLLNEEMMPIASHYCSNFKIRRNFGYVVLTAKLKNNYRSQVFEIIKNIGESIIEIDMSDTQKIKEGCFRQIGELHVNEADFLKLMRLMPSLRELSTEGWVKAGALSVQLSDVDFQLKRLKSFSGSIDLGNLTALIPSSLTSLYFYPVTDSSMAEILARQQELVNFSLYNLKINEFNYQPSNCRIKQLGIHNPVFPIKSEFQKFSNFMKIQKCVEDLNFIISKNDLKNNNDYTEILTHLLSLKTLKKLVIE